MEAMNSCSKAAWELQAAFQSILGIVETFLGNFTKANLSSPVCFRTAVTQYSKRM
jgi:hypothetical protein